MELYVYDRDMNLLGVVDTITSLIWTRKYQACGDFKLLVPFTPKLKELLQEHRIVMKKGSHEAAEILYIHIFRNTEGKEEMEIQGRLLLNWLGKRSLIAQIATTADTAQNLLYRHVRENITAPKDAARRIPGVEILERAAFGDPALEYQSEEYAGVLLSAEALAKVGGVGIRMVTDVRQKKHSFDVYKGRDLTADQTVNPPCIFSLEFDNVLEEDFTQSTENLKNMAYVIGATKTTTVGQVLTGLDRNELVVMASDITKTFTNEKGVAVTLTDAQLLAALVQRGNTELEQYAKALSFASKVNTRANLQYGQDYDLGDRVTCMNKRWGVKLSATISEAQETYQQNQTEVEITFGESVPTLFQKIRQTAKQ